MIPREQLSGMRARRGTASVELALILPTLMLLLFGAIEVGVMVRASSAVNHIAGEAVRAAAVGASPTLINEHVTAVSTGLNPAQLSVTSEYRAWDADTQAWTDWTTLGASGAVNNAPRGSQIRVTISYPHSLLMPGLFAGVLGSAEDGSVSLSATVVTIRE